MTTIELLMARNGGRMVNSTSGALTGLASSGYVSLVVNEDAVLSVLKDGDANNMLTDFTLTAIDAALKSGLVISPAKQGLIDEITVTSGSVYLIKG